MNDVALLHEAIRRSGVSVAAFARDVMLRSPSTVRRWLQGTSPMPREVRAYLHRRRAWLERPLSA